MNKQTLETMLVRIRKEKELKRTVFTCSVCGKQNLTYVQVAGNLYVHSNDYSSSRSISRLEEGICACGEQCRKEAVLRGIGVGYGHLMLEGMDGYIIPREFLPQKGQENYSLLSQWNVYEEDALYYDAVTLWLQDSPSFKNGWMFIGTTGTGKTSLACAIVHELRKRELTVRFATGAEIADDLSSIVPKSYSFEKDRIRFFDKYTERDVLIIDDFTDIDFTDKLFTSLMEKLYNQHKLLIITANADPEQLGKMLDARLYSRLKKQCLLLPFTGQDYRGV